MRGERAGRGTKKPWERRDVTKATTVPVTSPAIERTKEQNREKRKRKDEIRIFIIIRNQCYLNWDLCIGSLPHPVIYTGFLFAVITFLDIMY